MEWGRLSTNINIKSVLAVPRIRHTGDSLSLLEVIAFAETTVFFHLIAREHIRTHSTMSKLLVVFGATGQQGGSVAKCVLADPELSKQYKIRAISRDPSSPASQALQKQGIEVVKADLADQESIKQALHGAHTVFGVTVTDYVTPTKDLEVSQGKLLADATVAAGAQYLIWSSSTNVTKNSHGNLTHVFHFDGKAEIEAYIRTLPIKSAFFAPGSFMQNYQTQSAPRPVGEGTYAIHNIVKPTTPMPLIDVSADSGKWVAAILAEPDKYEGKVLAAATKMYTYDEIVSVMSKVTGKTIKYEQLPDEIFKGFMPPHMAEPMVQMFQYMRDYGYYGANSEEQVGWSAKQARGKLTTLEEYLEREPLKL